MIPFEMKILNYKNGTYTVEYLPRDTNCTPIRLDIKLDLDTLTSESTVIEKLKQSSPQEFWNSELDVTEIDHDVLSRLVNTTHVVDDMSITGGEGQTTPFRRVRRQHIQAPLSSSSRVVPSSGADPDVGESSPEEVAGPGEQNIIRLKILIQQVLQEMAEGTV